MGLFDFITGGTETTQSEPATTLQEEQVQQTTEPAPVADTIVPTAETETTQPVTTEPITSEEAAEVVADSAESQIGGNPETGEQVGGEENTLAV